MIIKFNNWQFYKAKVSYLGTFFQGWQSQIHKNTVQDTLETALYSIFKKKQKIIGASRTDAGVHADGQVFIFQGPKIQLHKLTKIINNILPESIFIVDLNYCLDSFHPRFDAKKKIYTYQFSYKKQMPNLALRIHEEKKYLIQMNSFHDYTSMFIGTHNFRSFCSEEQDKNTIRTIFDISLKQSESIFIVTFIGNGFLRYMIRRLLGAIIECNSKQNKAFLKKIFLSENNKNNLYMMPSKGLILKNIIYNT